MDPILQQKYIYVHYHLISLLRKWKQEEPYFNSRVTATISPALRRTIVLRLSCFLLQINNAVIRLTRVIDNVQIFLATKQRHNITVLLHQHNCGYNLKDTACTITRTKIEVLLEKFKETEPIPFEMLPYDFQNRLVALLSPSDLIRFKFAGKTALKYVHRRGMFSKCPQVIESSSHYNDVKKTGRYGPDIISKSRFLKLDTWHIIFELYLFTNTPKMFDHAVKIFSGEYFYVSLEGAFTWKHAIHLMNASKRIKYAILRNGMQIDAFDYDDFFEAVVKWLEKEHTIMLDLDWSAYHFAFPSQFMEYINSQTSFNAIINFNYISVFKHPPFD
uniref:F-box domain-containing protein n=1 Tax=Panagrellus redivivus TaxID=6233 RepID=A0A7E4UQI2_PANRE